MPAGYYDRSEAAWIASDDGRVIEILSITDGYADLNVDDDSEADAGDQLTALGITDGERQQLASHYSDSIPIKLWRVPITHFTPWDFNWPFGPPLDAIAPDLPEPEAEAQEIENDCQTEGSIIHCASQSLSEVIEIGGTPFKLTYNSARTAGRTGALNVNIPIVADNLTELMSTDIKGVQVEMEIAGNKQTLFVDKDELQENQAVSMEWDGKNSYGQTLPGGRLANIKVGYVYPIVYHETVQELVHSFARLGGVPLDLTRDGQQVRLWQESAIPVGTLYAAEQGLGGWQLNVHHTLNRHKGVLYAGDGTLNEIGSALSQNYGIHTIFDGNEEPPNFTPAGMAMAPDGSLIIADPQNNRVWRLADGQLTVVAGTGEPCSDSQSLCGDNEDPLDAELNGPIDVAIGPEGIYIADRQNNKIRLVTTDIITTVAGTGYWGLNDDLGPYPAREARFKLPSSIAITPDGSLFIADTGNNLVHRVDPITKMISRVVGNTALCTVSEPCGDGGPLLEAAVSPKAIALDDNNQLYIADTYRVRKIDLVAETINTIAGNGEYCSSWIVICEVSGTATSVRLEPADIVIYGSSLYIADKASHTIRLFSSDYILTIAGTGQFGANGHDGIATEIQLANPLGLAITANNELVIADTGNRRIRQLEPTNSHFDLTGGNVIIPSDDGRMLYEFSPAGRHLYTRDALTLVPLYSFSYSEEGFLSGIRDRNGRETLIERTDDGHLAKMISPDGQETSFTQDEVRLDYIGSVTYPTNETTSFDYTPLGLMTNLRDERDGEHLFTYDSMGRLIRDSNPVEGVKVLQRSNAYRGWQVDVTNALSDTSTFTVQKVPGGGRKRTAVTPDGETTTSILSWDRSETRITRPDGTVTTLRYAPDPRFYGSRYLTHKTIGLISGGIFYDLSINRIVELQDDDDPFSLVEYREEVTINGRTTTTTFDAEIRTYTTIDPAGKEVMTELDALGRPVSLETTGLARVAYEYDDGDDGSSRISGITQGTGVDARTTGYEYDPDTGYPTSITDAAGNSTTYQHDDMGRVTQQTLPTGHLLTYEYDSAGNLVSHTNAQGIEATYEYDSQNRMIAMTVSPDGRAVRTEYEYDTTNNLVKRISDAGGAEITTSYEWEPLDAAGNYVISSVTDPLGGVTSYSYIDGAKVESITDALGRTTTISYTPEGWQEAITAPDGSTTTYTYNDDGQPTSVTDGRGSTTTYSYDAATGRLASVTKGSAAVSDWPAVNLTISYQYDASGRIASITTADGTTSFAYDDFGRLIQIADPAGNTSTLTYDALDRVIERTVGANIPASALTMAYTYDEIGRLLTEQVDPQGLALMTQYNYDIGGGDTWNLQQITDPLGYDTEYRYNSLGLRDQMTDPQGQSWTFHHDNLGRLLQISDPLAKTTAYQYDANGRRTGMTNPLGDSTSYQYDAVGNLTQMIDALGHITQLSYDEMNRISERAAPLGQTISYDYDTAGNVISITDPLGNATTYAYDSANQLAQSTNANSQTTSFEHDGMGRVSAITDPGNITTGYTYDSAGYLVATTDGLGRTQEYVYDAIGRLTDKIDAAGIVSHYSYDSAGRLAAVTENYRPGVTPNEETNVVTSYTYDANGNLLTVLDANGNSARSYQYNARNQVTTLSNALGHTKSYAYTQRGELASMTDGKGQTTSYDYSDLAGQLTQITRPDESVSFGYDELGRLEEMLDSLGTTSFTYDDLSRLTAVTDPFNQTVGYGYDALGNRTSLTYPDNNTVDYTYDPLRRINTVTDWEGKVTDYAYDNSSRLSSIVYPNSVTTNLTYDDAHQLTNLQHAGGSTSANFAYQYDDVGNRSRAIEQLAGNNSTIDYDYDALYRLTDADYSSGTFFDYAYDAAGNRLSKSDNAGSTNYVYDAANRLTSVNGQAVSYDDNGNLLTDGANSYTYDTADRLTSVTNGGNLTEFAYNGLGNRLQQTINGTATTYQLDLNTPLPQVLSDGSNSYLYGNGRIGEYGTSGWAYHHADALGSVRLLTNGAGTVTGEASYTPFGEVMTSSTADSAFGFAGEQTDDTGLQYLRARYYAPETGRFLTTDPFAGRQSIPYSLHPYQYGYSNPLNYVDPSGLCVNVGGFGAIAVSAVSCLGQAVSGVASTVGGMASTLGTLATAASPVGVAGNMYMGMETSLDYIADYTEPFAPGEVFDSCAGSSICASTSASGDTLSIAPILEPLGGFTEAAPLEPLPGFEVPSLEFDPLGGFTESLPLESLGGFTEPPSLPPVPPLVPVLEEEALICAYDPYDNIWQASVADDGETEFDFGDWPEFYEVGSTIDRIRRGDTSLYPGTDGTPFYNTTNIVPEGNYTEWTVPDPRLTHRGSLRILFNVDTGVLYFTRHHYKHGKRVFELDIKLNVP